MINATLDLITFLQSNFSMLFALALYAILAVVLSKSIKKHYKVYYWVFGLLCAGFVIPVIARLCGFSLPFSFGKIPFFGLCISELSSAANFVHPVLIIIMYMGAFSPKNQYVGRLMSIRKELSIIVGFPVIAHAMKRLFGSFVQGWQFFFDNETYMQSPRVSSALGSGISSFVYVLGLVMFVLFLVLWITSFDSVHKALGAKRWKAVQKWSYGLYAMLFIHAMGLNLGGYISDVARAEQQAQQIARVEVVEQHESRGERPQQQSGEQRPQGAQQGQQQGQAHGQQQGQQPQQAHGQQQGQQQGQAQQGGHGHGPQAFKFSDISINRTNKRLVNMAILVLIYGSYLYFRLRKARQDRAKKSAAANRI
ncbi:MAG: hypothetical protein SNJ33_07535 [Rikenellaceae bacterium]